MRYFLIILLFISGAAVAQPVSQRSNGQNTMMDPHLMAGRSLIIPVYPDTTTANNGLDSVGKIIFSKVDTAIYVRGGNTGHHIWRKIAGGSGGGGGISFVVTDSTLTGHGTGSDSLRVNFNKVQRKITFTADFVYSGDSLYINWANATAIGFPGSVQYMGSDGKQKGDQQILWDSTNKILKVGNTGTSNGQVLAGNNATGTFKGGGDVILQGNNATIEALNTGNLIKFRNNGADKIAIDQNGAISLNGLGNYGTAGQILTSGGAGSPATWTTPATIDTTALKGTFLPLFFPSAKTVQQNGNLSFFTNGTTQIDSLKLSRTAGGALAGSDSLVGFGHSIMVGANSSPYSDSSFFARMGRFHGLHTTNKAISGSVMYSSCQQQMRYINYPHTATTTYMSALNTVRAMNILTNRATVNSVQNAYKAMWLNHFAKTTVPCGDASVTRSGSWTTGYDANPNGAGKSTNAAYTSAAGAYAEWTTTDSSIAVQILGYNTGAGGAANVTISVDGVVQNTLNTNGVFDGQGGAQQPIAFIYTGLSLASHTIRVTNVGGAQMIVDYFTALRPAATAPAFVVYHDPRMNSTGYAGGQASDAAIDTLNAKIDSIMSTLPNPWRTLKTFVVKTESRYVVSTGISPDGIHPSNIGHGQIAQAEQDLFAISASDSGSVRYSGITGELLVDNKPLAFKNNMGLQNVLNNNPTLNVSDTIFGSNTPLTFKNFSTLNIDNFNTKGASFTSLSGVATFKQYGTINTYGANGGLVISSRSVDTTKNFVFYSGGPILSIFDGWKQRNVINIDTSYRTVFLNNPFNNPSATSTVDIAGNVFGTPGHSPLGIGTGILMVTPERNKIENTGDDLYYSDSSTQSITNFIRRKVETQKMNALSTSAASPFTLFSIPIPTNKLMEVEFTVEGVDGSGNTAFMTRILRAYNNAGTVTVKGGGPIGTYADTFDVGMGSPALTATVSGTSVNVQITAGNSNLTTWTSIRGVAKISP